MASKKKKKKKKNGYSSSSLFTVLFFFFYDVEFHLYSFALNIQLSHHHLLQILQKLLFTMELSPHPCLTRIDHIQLSRINKSFTVLLSEVPVPHPLPIHTHTHTHTHTRLKILTAKFQKQTIHFWHHSELHDQLSHSVLPWMQIISLSSVSHALVTHQLLRYQLDQSTVVVSQCLCSSSLYFT